MEYSWRSLGKDSNVPPPPEVNDPKFIAAVELIGTTGADSFQIRYSDDQEPVIWIAAAVYRSIPNNPLGGSDAAAGLTPLMAVMRLCKQLIDGGECTHCHRTTLIAKVGISELTLDASLCCYTYNEEKEKYVSGCNRP